MGLFFVLAKPCDTSELPNFTGCFQSVKQAQIAIQHTNVSAKLKIRKVLLKKALPKRESLVSSFRNISAKQKLYITNEKSESNYVVFLHSIVQEMKNVALRKT